MMVFGTGRFTKDPVLKEVNETVVCEFTLAVDEFRMIQGERKKYTNFFNFSIWDKAAEVIAKYRKKGDQLEFYGTPRQDKWVDKDGNNRERVFFRVDQFRLLSRAAANRVDSEAPEDNGTEENVPENEATPF